MHGRGPVRCRARCNPERTVGPMSDTRYGHSSTGGGSQDEPERKDEGWQSRQGGSQARREGSKGDPTPREQPGDDDRGTQPPPGTNTQGELAGIREASRETEADRERNRAEPDRPASEEEKARSGTDQPPRMGGPLGPDPKHPHLPEGAQNPDTQGTGAGGFDRGVNATQVGAVHQGVKEERD
jgi:hypothetical protein